MYRRLWQYYSKLADAIGTKPTGEDYAFSLKYFYRQMEAEDGIDSNLNSLTKAFLGDEDSKRGMSVATKDELEEMEDILSGICDESLNSSQTEAVAQALLNDVTLIQGPPGTGKTETIKNIVRGIRRLFPEATIAVISANGEALNNAFDAVNTDEDLKKEAAFLGASDKRKTFLNKIKEEDNGFYRQLSSERDFKWKEKNECWESYQFPDLLFSKYPIIFSTIHSIRRSVKTDTYDYVIVDECSQVPTMLGLVALSLANHLVLLGDDEQLPPIHKEDVNLEDDISDIRDTKPFFIDEGDNSFLKAAGKSFGTSCGSVLLNEHYRCHPAIINFCNKYVYDNRLIPRSKDDGKLPIRIRWYEGEYWEKTKREDLNRSDNYNKKQIEIFINEEYPEILSLLAQNNNYSICVLSPYRKQLELLKERLDEIYTDDISGVENVLEDEGTEDGEQRKNDIPQLTIHKAQGRGYDRVYILPVEDTGIHPWSQKKELINVAVSRAKKELCIITSSNWMPKKVQTELLGYCIENKTTKGNGYLKDLLSYVWKESKKRCVEDGYGFVKADTTSIFDKVSFYRKEYYCQNESTKEGHSYRMSAPEHCMYDALKTCDAICDNFQIYNEVPLKAIENIVAEDEAVQSFINNGARFDFVITKDDVIYGIIEVDGAYHRSDPEAVENDDLKDRAVASLGEDFKENRFLRFPTDGTTEDEITKIRECLENAFKEETVSISREYKREVIRMSEYKKFIDYFDELMEECAGIVDDHIVDGEADVELNAVISNYANPQGTNYHYDEALSNAVYFLRYGYAYAFEYQKIYEIILKDWDGEDIFGVTSLGCGSGIDAWSLYVAMRENRPELQLRYAGLDRKKWAIQFNGEVMQNAYTHNEDKLGLRLPGREDYPEGTGDILDFLRNRTWQYTYNTILFPKILNELPDDVLDEMLTIIREKADRFTADRNHYICISHSKAAYSNPDSRQYRERMRRIAREIVEAINYDNRFEVEDSLPENDGVLRNVASDNEYCCYEFKKEGKYYPKVKDLDDFFYGEGYVKEVQDKLNECLQHNCVTTTSTSLFQIIKLSPR